MSVTTNYHKRLIDLSVFHGVKAIGIATVDQSLFNQGGEVCTGIQKLIQRWLITFLTPKGSVKFHPEWGTPFLENATSFKNEMAAESSFYMCNSIACDQLKQNEDDSMPDEERIQGVSLISITVNTTGFNLKVRLVSRAGNTAPLILPITLNPLQL